MFMALSGWFGAETRRQRSGRMPGRLSFALRFEDLKGRATPGGLADGVFAEPTAVLSDVAVRSDSGIQVDPTSVPTGHGGGFSMGLGVNLCGGGVITRDVRATGAVGASPDARARPVFSRGVEASHVLRRLRACRPRRVVSIYPAVTSRKSKKTWRDPRPNCADIGGGR
jgi:hypothetical protein